MICARGRPRTPPTPPSQGGESARAECISSPPLRRAQRVVFLWLPPLRRGGWGVCLASAAPPRKNPLNPPFVRGDVLPVSRGSARPCKTPPSELAKGGWGV